MSERSDTPQPDVDAWFAAHASTWDEIYEPGAASVGALVYQRRQRLALGWIDSLELPRADRVLEVGCGAGRATIELARRGFSVVAIDSVAAMLEIARARATRQLLGDCIQFVHADVHALSFRPGTFRLVLALGVLPWLHSPANALREIARSLEPGGYALVSADNRLRATYLLDPRLSPALGGLRRAARVAVGLEPRSPADLPRLHSPTELDDLLARSGLFRLREATCGFGPFSLFGQPILPVTASVWIDAKLQALADAQVRGIRSAGAHHVVLAIKGH